MYLRRYFVEKGLTLIESMLLESVLTNIEVACNLSLNEIETLEKCHEMGLRKILNLSGKTLK